MRHGGTAALDRGLAGALTAWLRQAVNPASPAAAVAHFADALAPLETRVRAGSSQGRNLARRAAELHASLSATTHADWGTLRPGRASTGFLRSLGEDAPAADDNADAVTTTWLVPTSMRSVDAEAGARAIRHTKQAAPPSPPTTDATGGPVPAEEDVF